MFVNPTEPRPSQIIQQILDFTGVINSGYIGCHSLRATGITAYLEHPDARVEVAQYLAGHTRTETTRLYDRREEQVSLDEVERIGI